MALFADPIDSAVLAQIKAREKLMAAGFKGNALGPRNPNIIQAQNSTSWIRLASSVNINGESDLAENTILSGGTRSEGGALRGGLKGAYDLDPKMGYRPMAGIQGASFEYYNNGALAKADIELVCYTPEQFNRIEKLFLRPGYSVLLEWGHTSYTTNGTDVVFYETTTSPALSDFLTTGKESPDIAASIIKHRKNTHYNYEAFHGIIVNFKWTFNPDNSYKITVNTITQGSIIESFKINNATQIKVDADTKAEKEKLASDKAALESEEAGGSSAVGDFLDASSDKIGFIAQGVLDTLVSFSEGFFNLVADLGPFDFIDDNTWLNKLKEKGDTSQIHNILWNIATTFPPSQGSEPGSGKIEEYTGNIPEISPIDVIRIDFNVDSSDDQDLGNHQYYITLGGFLRIFKNNFLVRTKAGGLYVDIETRPGTTPMVTFPGQFSADPLICLIPILGFPDKSLTFTGNFACTNDLPAHKNLSYHPPQFGTENEKTLLDLMQVYVNFNYIMKVVEDSVDEKGSAPLIDFIKNLLSGINTALGGVNKFDTRVIEEVADEDGKIKKTLSIYDEGAHIRTATKPPVHLKPYGVDVDGGTTFTDIQFSSELSNEFASMISIGAQANGNQVGENATAFSQFNEGLIDRITEEKITASTSKEATPKEVKPKDKFISSIDGINTALLKIYKNFQISKDNIETLTSANTTYASFLQGYITTDLNATPPPFFIPFNLSFTLKGIAGIRIFDKLYLDDGILPESYKGKVAFLAKNVKHEINKNYWTTTVDTLTVPTIVESKKLDVTLNKAIAGDPIVKGFPEINEDRSYGANYGGNGGPPGKGGQTLTLKNTLGPIYYEGPTEKSLIVLHHTAGYGNAKMVVDVFNARTDRVSTHFVLEKGGTFDQLYGYGAWGYHLGIDITPFQRAGLPDYINHNKTSIGIEIINIGPLEKGPDGKFRDTVGKRIYKEGEVSISVDANGNQAPYKGYLYWEKFPPAQIAGLEHLLRDIISKHPKCKIKYNYKDCFPAHGTESVNAIKGVPGIYTHNSFKQQKVDVAPVPEIIGLLKRLSSEDGDEFYDVFIDNLSPGGQFYESLYDEYKTTFFKVGDGYDTRLRPIYRTATWSNEEWAAAKEAMSKMKQEIIRISKNSKLTKGVPYSAFWKKRFKASNDSTNKGWNEQYLAYLAWSFGSEERFYDWQGEDGKKKVYVSPNTLDNGLEDKWEALLDRYLIMSKVKTIAGDILTVDL